MLMMPGSLSKSRRTRPKPPISSPLRLHQMATAMPLQPSPSQSMSSAEDLLEGILTSLIPQQNHLV